MTQAQITITGGVAVARRLQNMISSAAGAQQSVIQPLGTAWKQALIDETPKGRGEQGSGKRLAASYTTDEQYSGRGASYRISNRAPQLGYVLRGRGPIVAKGRALRFVIDGQVFFRKRVGPAAANNFPPRAHAKVAGQIASAPQRIAQAIVRLYRG